MTEQLTLVTKSADKVLRREMPDGEAKRLPDGFKKPEDGDWVCMSAEVPPEDEASGDVVRVSGLNTARHTDKSPIKLLGQHLRGTMDGSPAIIGRMEEFRLGKKSWKGKHKGLWEGGYLDSVSIGFRPVKSRALNSEKPWDGYEFLESELVELSIVTIPANPAATALKAIADAFHTKEVNHASDEQDKSADTLAPHLTRLEALLDQMQDALAVAKSDDAEQTRDHGTPQEQPTIDPDALRAAIKSLL
jgi:hypothetical protein